MTSCERLQVEMIQVQQPLVTFCSLPQWCIRTVDAISLDSDLRARTERLSI